MNVIVTSADLQRRHFVLPRYAAEIGPDAMFNFRLQISDAIFGAEDNVIMELGICILCG